MIYCRKCRVNINGSKRCCPLCRSELIGEKNLAPDVYPDIAAQRYSRGFALRLTGFIAVCLAVIDFAVCILIRADMWIALAILAAIGCLWINITVGIIQRKHIFRNFTWQLFSISVFAVLWDLCTTWRGWSIDFVIPISCIVSMLSMVVISKIKKIPAGDYLLYVALDAVYGIVPVIFIFTEVLNVRYPSIICVACSIVSVAALILFEGRRMVYEIRKKMSL